MEELIAEFHADLDAGAIEAIDETARVMNRCRNMAWSLIQDRLEDSMNGGQELPLGWLSNIAGDTADRTGYTKRTENVNINIDAASTLTKAIARSARADEYRGGGGLTIEGGLTIGPPRPTIELSSPMVSGAVEQRPPPAQQGQVNPQAPVPAPAPQPFIVRRRA
jgi:hypothetical protein